MKNELNTPGRPQERKDTMDFPELGTNLLNRVPSRLLSVAERYLKNVPLLRDRLAKETDSMLAEMEGGLKPYRGQIPTFDKLPPQGLSREEVLREMGGMRAKEEDKWKEGYVSGAVYHGDAEHIDFLNHVYALNSQSNPLHADLWPSATKFEAEVVAMTANMLGAAEANAGRASDEHICGSVSSGGTESIMLAMKTYRDWARETKGITRPEMVAPSSAHPAFDKAAHYFGIKMIRVPVGPDYRADVKATRKALTRNTIVLIGSAPGFPHGVIDPIEALSELARKRGIGFHTDACLGGFVLPWARKLGYPVPDFDFRLPGVTSMSADTHKFGYAAKGTSVVLYRGTELRSYQYFTATEWPGGIYFSPTFSGSRPGALIAAAWASLVATGEAGYLDSTRRILETADALKRGIRAIPGLHVLGEPLFVIAFGSGEVDIYKVMEQMGAKGWSLNGLHKPAAVHLCVTLRHAQPGVAERFLEDLKAAVEHVRAHPGEKGTLAPVYGMAATVPFRGLLSDLLKKYMDLIYKV
jgi:glutamate/tyrosine decarboxylase-like PLP-dependent enzyme